MTQSVAFSCNAYLDPTGRMKEARIGYQQDQWTAFEIAEALAPSSPSSYLTPTLPVEIHCHGIGHADFSEFETIDLEQVNEQARCEGILCVLCIFLAQSKLQPFLAFMQDYARLRREGKLTHIVGVGLEGPLLSSVGGTPEQGTWVPDRKEWKQLACCGAYGLVYMVVSPDALWHRGQQTHDFATNKAELEWIASTLLDANIKLALGHFQKRDPLTSAAYTACLIELAKKRGYPPFSGMIMTDHLFNDMPLKFRHAWRGAAHRARRNEEIKHLRLEQWTLENLPEMVGEIPALLMQAAHEGWVTLCLNFDGEHVDLDVCRRVVELVGPDSLIAMTDRIDVGSLGGEPLEQREGSHLWYQKYGIVAAGSSSIDRQMRNLRSIGVSEADLWKIVSLTPLRILGVPVQHEVCTTLPERGCLVIEQDQRYYLENRRIYSLIVSSPHKVL